MVVSFWRQSVTRVRPAVKKVRGTDVPDWENPDRLTIEHCSVQPSTTALEQEGRVLGISEGMNAYMPPSADVQAGDRIEYEGGVYLIDGEPKRMNSASGNLTHIALSLRRWRG